MAKIEHNSDDQMFMLEALKSARQARDADEVPVGAVLVKDGCIVGKGANQPIMACDPTAHAEVVAIREASRLLQNYRLPGTTLYVTLEPCSMCIGVMVHARIERLVYGAPEPKSGAVESAVRLLEAPAHNHRIDVTGGVLSDECAALIKEFFRARRKII